MTRSMAKVAAAIAMEQLVAIAPSQSCKIQNFDFNVLDGFNQAASHVLKREPIANFNMP